MSLEREITGIKNKLRPFFEKTSFQIESQKRKFGEKWRGEDIVLKKSLHLQEKIDHYSHTETDVHNISETLKLYGVVNGQIQVSDDDISRVLKSIRTSDAFKDFEIDGLLLNYASTDPGPKFKQQALEYLGQYCEQEVMTFLFHTAREQAAKPFDKEKELRQIRAVQHMLMGDHVAMVTGDGKTSVVIPIFTIYKTLFDSVNENGLPSIITSSADDTLTQDIQTGIEKYKQAIKQSIQGPGSIEMRRYIDSRLKPLPQESPSTKDPTPKNEVGKLFTDSPNPLIWDGINKVKIGSRSHDDIIFETIRMHRQLGRELGQNDEKDPMVAARKVSDQMKTTMPTILFDEAHLLDQSPFILEQNRQEIDGKIKVNLDYLSDRLTLIDYLTLRLTQEELLKEPGVLVFGQQQLQLTDKGIKRLSVFRKNLIKELKEYLDFPNLYVKNKGKLSTVGSLKKIISHEINAVCDFNKADQDKLLNSMLEFWQAKEGSPLDLLGKYYRDNGGVKDSLPQKEKVNDPDSYLSDMLGNFLRTIGSLQKGVHYINPSVLRDNLRGTLLTGRRFAGNAPFYLNLLEKNPLMAETPRIYNQMNFYTWLNLIAQGNVISLSNDLYYTDPTTGKRELSPLGEVLEKYTDGYVIDLAPKKEVSEILPIPQPLISENTSRTVDQISLDLIKRTEKQEKRPELVVCWDEAIGQVLYKKLSKKGVRLKLITTQTPNDEANMSQQQLANREIDILITTGRKSFAADFKDNSGNFTDLRVNVIDPETVFQVHQAFGRRRLEKSEKDFSIYFDQDFLLDLSTILTQDENKLPILLKDLFKSKDPLFPEIEDLVKKYIEKTISQVELNKLKENIIEVLKRNQRKNVGEWEKEVEFESYFVRIVSPYVEKVKEELVESNWRKAYSPMHQIIEEESAQILASSNLPELPLKFKKDIEIGNKNRVIDFFSALEEDLYKEYQNLIYLTQQNPYLRANIEALKGEVFTQMEQIVKNNYKPLWESQLNEGEGQYLQKSLRSEIKNNSINQIGLLEFVVNQLKPMGFNIENIDDMSILFSPKYQSNPANAFVFADIPINTGVTRACYNQMIFRSRQGNKFFLDANSGVYRPINEKVFEDQVNILNGFADSPFVGKRYVDLYFPVENSTRFVRVVVKGK